MLDRVSLLHIINQAGGGGGQASPFASFIPIILIFFIFYFLIIRPQQKKTREHQDMLKSLKRGEEVMTSGGVFGTIRDINGEEVTLEIADKVRVKVARAHISGYKKQAAAKTN